MSCVDLVPRTSAGRGQRTGSGTGATSDPCRSPCCNLTTPCRRCPARTQAIASSSARRRKALGPSSSSRRPPKRLRPAWTTRKFVAHTPGVVRDRMIERLTDFKTISSTRGYRSLQGMSELINQSPPPQVNLPGPRQGGGDQPQLIALWRVGRVVHVADNSSSMIEKLIANQAARAGLPLAASLRLRSPLLRSADQRRAPTCSTPTCSSSLWLLLCPDARHALSQSCPRRSAAAMDIGRAGRQPQFRPTAHIP